MASTVNNAEENYTIHRCEKDIFKEGENDDTKNISRLKEIATMCEEKSNKIEIISTPKKKVKRLEFSDEEGDGDEDMKTDEQVQNTSSCNSIESEDFFDEQYSPMDDDDHLYQNKRKKRSRIRKLAESDEDENTGSLEKETTKTKKELRLEQLENLRSSREKKKVSVKKDNFEKDACWARRADRADEDSVPTSSDEDCTTPNKTARRIRYDSDFEDEASASNEPKEVASNTDSNENNSVESEEEVVENEEDVESQEDVENEEEISSQESIDDEPNVPAHFLMVLDTLLAEACHPGTLEDSLEENGEVTEAFDKLDNEIKFRIDRINSEAWKEEFRECSQLFPEITVRKKNDISFVDCEACHKKDRSSSEIRTFKGRRYSRKTLKEDEPSTTGSEYKKTEFYIGRYCAQRNDIYHDIYHYKYNLLKECEDKVEKIKTEDQLNETADIVEKALNGDEHWKTNQYSTLQSHFNAAENYKELLEKERKPGGAFNDFDARGFLLS